MQKRRLRATLVWGSESHAAVTEELSPREITLQTQWQVSVGTRLIVDLKLQSDHAVRFAALVRRAHHASGLLAGQTPGEVTIELVGTVPPEYAALFGSAEPRATPAPAPAAVAVRPEPPATTQAPTARAVSKAPRTAAELRRHPRYPIQLEASYEFYAGAIVERKHTSHTVMIGRGGCLLETHERTETVSRRLRVQLVLPSGEAATMMGYIAWANAPRLGAAGGALLAPGTMGVCFDTGEVPPAALLSLLAECEIEAQAAGTAPPRVTETTELPVRHEAAATPAPPREVALTRAEAFRRRAAAQAAATPVEAPVTLQAAPPTPATAPPAPERRTPTQRPPAEAPSVEAMLRAYAETVPEPAPPLQAPSEIEAMLRDYTAAVPEEVPARDPSSPREVEAIDALLRDFLTKTGSAG